VTSPTLTIISLLSISYVGTCFSKDASIVFAINSSGVLSQHFTLSISPFTTSIILPHIGHLTLQEKQVIFLPKLAL
jgi:hypothetical protein